MFFTRDGFENLFRTHLDERGLHLVEKIDAGSSAAIYKALDFYSDEDVVIKVFYKTGEQIRSQFIRERIRQLHINHPNVIRLISGGHFLFRGEEIYYFIYDYFRGEQLGRIPREILNQQPYSNRLKLAALFADGLFAIHQVYQAHNDLHEGNILVSHNPIDLRIIDQGHYSRGPSTTPDQDDFYSNLRLFLTDDELRNLSIPPSPPFLSFPDARLRLGRAAGLNLADIDLVEIYNQRIRNGEETAKIIRDVAVDFRILGRDNVISLIAPLLSSNTNLDQVVKSLVELYRVNNDAGRELLTRFCTNNKEPAIISVICENTPPLDQNDSTSLILIVCVKLTIHPHIVGIILDAINPTIPKRFPLEKAVAILIEIGKITDQPEVLLKSIEQKKDNFSSHQDFVEQIKEQFKKRIRDTINPRFRFFDDWSKDENIVFPEKFLVDKYRKNVLDSIRKLLGEKSSSISRISGISGIGKTRLVFESLNTNEFKEKVIYCDIENLSSSECTVLMKGVPSSNIVVLDNCERIFFEELSRFYSNNLENHIITIAKFLEEEHQNEANAFVLQPLSIEETNGIISAVLPGIKNELREKIHDLSSCIPKFIIYISKNYQGTGTLTNESQFPERFFQKMVTGTYTPESVYWTRCKNILMYAAIFDRIGYSGSSEEEHIQFSVDIGLQQIFDSPKTKYLLSEEGQWLSQKLNISWVDFQGMVRDLNSKGILTIDHRIGIEYPLIEGFMVNEWWRLHGETASTLLKTIPETFSSDLRDKFFDMLIYVDMVDARIYSNVNDFLNIVMLDKDYSELVMDFVFYHWNALRGPDRTMIIRGLASINDFRVDLCRFILFNRYGEVSLEEKKRWLDNLMQFDDCLEQVCESLGILFRLHPKNPLNNFLFDKLSQSELPPTSAQAFLVQILENIDLFPEVAITKLKQYSKDATFSLLLEAQLIQYARNLDKKLFSELIENLISLPRAFEGNVLAGLTLLLESYFDLFEEHLSRKIILKILGSEEKAILVPHIIVNEQNQSKLAPDFIEKIRQKISRYQTPQGLASRKLLSKLIPFETNEEVEPSLVDQIISKRNDTWNEVSLGFLRCLDDLKNRYPRDLQLKYKPDRIQLIILTEYLTNPIKSLNSNWFYNPFSKNPCVLFAQIMPQIFPDYPENADPRERSRYLKEFSKLGFYTDGVYPFPEFDDNLKDLWFEKNYLIRLEALITKATPIIIIGEGLYQKIASNLRQRGYKIINEDGIPSPDEEAGGRFKTQFQNALQKAGFKVLF